MVWGAIAGALIGGVMGNNAANTEAKARDRATEANMAGFNLARPNLSKLYGGAANAYDDYIATGPYKGTTLAAPNPYATDAYNKIGGMSGGLMDNAFNMANTGSGFGSNYQDLYNRSMGGGALTAANEYALANKDPLVNAAMRDDERTLNEQTLPGINMSASATGNVNSSRAGVADALAERAVDDRRGYLDTVVQKDLRNQYLGQYNTDNKAAMAANAGLSGAYSTGIGGLGTTADYGTGAGNALSAYEDARLRDEANRYNTNLNFGFDAVNKFGNVMSGAPSSVSGIQPNLVDRTAGTIGGAMAGFGAGNRFSNYLGNMPFAQPSRDMGNINPYATLFGNA